MENACMSAAQDQKPTSPVVPIRLGQVLSGERTIPLKAAAVERRRARLAEKLAAEKDVRAERRAREQDEFYASLGEGGGEGGE
jgi:hypothetical protein